MRVFVIMVKESEKQILQRMFVIIILAFPTTWVVVHYGNTSGAFLPHDLSGYHPPSSSGNVFYIQQFGYVDDDSLAYIKEFLSSDTKLPVKILPVQPIPADHGNRDDQVDIDKLLKTLKKADFIPKDAFRVIGITSEDLYYQDMNWVFGVGEMGKWDCVISLFRLFPKDEEGRTFRKPEDRLLELYHSRIRKILRHEIGHTYCLPHCDDDRCAMVYDDNVYDFDLSGEYFCNNCAILMALNNKNF